MVFFSYLFFVLLNKLMTSILTLPSDLAFTAIKIGIGVGVIFVGYEYVKCGIEKKSFSPTTVIPCMIGSALSDITKVTPKYSGINMMKNAFDFKGGKQYANQMGLDCLKTTKGKKNSAFYKCIAKKDFTSLGGLLRKR